MSLNCETNCRLHYPPAVLSKVHVKPLFPIVPWPGIWYQFVRFICGHNFIFQGWLPFRVLLHIRPDSDSEKALDNDEDHDAEKLLLTKFAICWWVKYFLHSVAHSVYLNLLSITVWFHPISFEFSVNVVPMQVLLQNATNAMQFSKVPDILNLVRHLIPQSQIFWH